MMPLRSTSISMSRRRGVFFAKSWYDDSWAGQVVCEFVQRDCVRFLLLELSAVYLYLSFFFSSSVLSRISMTARSLGRPKVFLLRMIFSRLAIFTSNGEAFMSSARIFRKHSKVIGSRFWVPGSEVIILGHCLCFKTISGLDSPTKILKA